MPPISRSIGHVCPRNPAPHDRLTNNSLYIREDSMRNGAFGIVGGLESGFELGGVQHTVRFGGNAMTTDFSQELFANTAACDVVIAVGHA